MEKVYKNLIGGTEFTKSDTKVMKGIAIVFMLYHHLFTFPERIQESIEYQPLFMIEGMESSYLMGEFGKLCVALFVFLSGYGLYISCKSNKHITISLKNKVVHLYTMYWLVFAVFIPICIIKQVDKHITINTFFGNLSGLNITYNGEWWFFTPYILLLCVYPFLKKFYQWKHATPLGDIILWILFSIFAYKLLPSIVKFPVMESLLESFGWLKLKQVLQQLPAFMIGGIFAKYDILSYVKKNFGNNDVNGILALISMVILFWCRRFMGMEFDCILAPAFILTIIVSLQMKPMKFFYLVLKEIGDKSTFIWLTHSFYCYDLCQKFIFMPKYTVLIMLLLLTVSFITAVVLQKCYCFLEKAYGKIYEKADHESGKLE